LQNRNALLVDLAVKLLGKKAVLTDDQKKVVSCLKAGVTVDYLHLRRVIGEHAMNAEFEQLWCYLVEMMDTLKVLKNTKASPEAILQVRGTNGFKEGEEPDPVRTKRLHTILGSDKTILQPLPYEFLKELKQAPPPAPRRTILPSIDPDFTASPWFTTHFAGLEKKFQCPFVSCDTVGCPFGHNAPYLPFCIPVASEEAAQALIASANHAIENHERLEKEKKAEAAKLKKVQEDLNNGMAGICIVWFVKICKT